MLRQVLRHQPPVATVRLVFTAQQAAIRIHERLKSDPELVAEVVAFWGGGRIAVSRVREGLRQIGATASFSLRPVPMRELALQRFRFVSRLMLGAGFAGWALLFDEVELIGRYSLLQRGRS